ncbi:MAG: RING finger protein 166-like protein [Terrestrivirus sp.]|uniref:RING finger protein 166-like protein n=1 Tax=Terrestrivirus sp. TaxID=2487775 RepID=A0A3G4ZN18_9VIRU|nr:MAG: RING finger protein 166-like protein [Terrestrivirus sp.]
MNQQEKQEKIYKDTSVEYKSGIPENIKSVLFDIENDIKSDMKSSGISRKVVISSKPTETKRELKSMTRERLKKMASELGLKIKHNETRMEICDKIKNIIGSDTVIINSEAERKKPNNNIIEISSDSESSSDDDKSSKLNKSNKSNKFNKFNKLNSLNYLNQYKKPDKSDDFGLSELFYPDEHKNAHEQTKKPISVVSSSSVEDRLKEALKQRESIRRPKTDKIDLMFLQVEAYLKRVESKNPENYVDPFSRANLPVDPIRDGYMESQRKTSYDKMKQYRKLDQLKKYDELKTRIIQDARTKNPNDIINDIDDINDENTKKHLGLIKNVVENMVKLSELQSDKNNLEFPTMAETQEKLKQKMEYYNPGTQQQIQLDQQYKNDVDNILKEYYKLNIDTDADIDTDIYQDKQKVQEIHHGAKYEELLRKMIKNRDRGIVQDNKSKQTNNSHIKSQVEGPLCEYPHYNNDNEIKKSEYIPAAFNDSNKSSVMKSLAKTVDELRQGRKLSYTGNITSSSIPKSDDWTKSLKGLILDSPDGKINKNKLYMLYEKVFTRNYIDIEECENKDILDKEYEYTCSICTCIFNKPQYLQCGHTFCLDCINNIHNSKCPLCISSFSKHLITPNKELENMISVLRFKCPTCNKVHRTDNCSIYNVKCKKCKKEMPKNDFLLHIMKENYDSTDSDDDNDDYDDDSDDDNCKIATRCNNCNAYYYSEIIHSHKMKCHYMNNSDSDDDIDDIGINDKTDPNLFIGICEYCDVFYNKKTSKDHGDMCEGQYFTCKGCMKLVKKDDNYHKKTCVSKCCYCKEIYPRGELFSHEMKCKQFSYMYN